MGALGSVLFESVPAAASVYSISCCEVGVEKKARLQAAPATPVQVEAGALRVGVTRMRGAGRALACRPCVSSDQCFFKTSGGSVVPSGVLNTLMPPPCHQSMNWSGSFGPGLGLIC